jgi:hypothetical protein
VEQVPALVTLHVWRIPRTAIPVALARMALDRGRARRTPGVQFTKMLGTGSGFSLRDGDATRWAKLSTWSRPGPDPVAAGWDALAEESLRVDLRPLSSTGRWSRRSPFGDPSPRPGAGQVAALTRARLSPTKARAFWQAVPPVHADLVGTPGLRTALAVGEAPLGLQGTFSVWDSPEALREFTHGPAHRAAVAQTTRLGWYAEELFARFEVLGTTGTLNGRAL